MSKNIADLRFGATYIDKTFSCVFRLWATKTNDIYLAHQSFGGYKKYSFHASGINRSAVTKQEWGDRAEDRARNKWKRGDLPEIGKGQATILAVLCIPTSLLSDKVTLPNKPVFWLKAAPPGSATYIELLLTNESEKSVKSRLSKLPERELFFYKTLNNGSAINVTAYHQVFDERLPGFSPYKGTALAPNGIEIYGKYVDDSGRPIRISIENNPKDNDYLVVWNYGGCEIP